MTRASGPAIVVDELTKVYANGGRKRTGAARPAVDGISFSVEQGKIYGLLGPNGAGKTTTIKMLSTLLLPTAGTATVLGLDVSSDHMEIRKHINLVSGGERGLYYRITGKQNLQFFSDLYMVPRRARDENVARLLERVGLSDAADKRVEDYSRGMKQRLHIARALVNDPEVLFLDEPTIGLDPEIARDLRDMIRRMADEQKTVILTTHYMKEAEELCGTIGIISKGKIVASGPPSMLKDLVRDKSIIEVEALNVDEGSIDGLRATEGVQEVVAVKNGDRSILRVQVGSGSDMIPAIVSRLGSCRIVRVSNEEPTLEDAYLSLVSRNDKH